LVISAALPSVTPFSTYLQLQLLVISYPSTYLQHCSYLLISYPFSTYLQQFQLLAATFFNVFVAVPATCLHQLPLFNVFAALQRFVHQLLLSFFHTFATAATLPIS
jgi:hypothetical protein